MGQPQLLHVLKSHYVYFVYWLKPLTNKKIEETGVLNGNVQ